MARRGFDAGQVRRVVQRGERDEPADHFDHVVVDSGRLGEHVTAVHHPMPDRFDLSAQSFHLCDNVAERRGMVGDFFDDATRQAFAAVGVDDLVLDRRAAGVEHEHQHRQTVTLQARSAPTWMAVITIVLTMSVTVAPRDRSLTGLLSPWSTGPTATAPAERCTAL